MALTLELPPETERILRERAEKHHLPLEEYLRTLVESSLSSNTIPARRPARTQEEMQAFLTGMSQFPSEAPQHLGETWSRETIYDDHD